FDIGGHHAALEHKRAIGTQGGELVRRRQAQPRSARGGGERSRLHDLQSGFILIRYCAHHVPPSIRVSCPRRHSSQMTACPSINSQLRKIHSWPKSRQTNRLIICSPAPHAKHIGQIEPRKPAPHPAAA